MALNQLRGSRGDELNVIFAAAKFNIWKRVRAFTLFFLYRFFKAARTGLEKEERGKERTFPQKIFPSRIRFLHNRRIPVTE